MMDSSEFTEYSGYDQNNKGVKSIKKYKIPILIGKIIFLQNTHEEKLWIKIG